ncbi:MAG: general stress protein [Angustibacter sp.]
MVASTGPRTRRGRPVLALDFPQSLGVFDKYEDAQRAVDFLSDREFAVQNCMIVGTDLRQVERVTGRLTYARAAAAGAASGAWMGLFVGLLLSLFQSGGSAVAAILTGVLIGVMFGIAFAIASYAATGGRRDFTSVSQVVATRYEVLVEHRLLAQAQTTLQEMPGRPQQTL